FAVPHIPAIPERVQLGQCLMYICQGAHKNGLVPCVVLVFYHAAAADVNDSAASPFSCLTQRWPRTMHSAAPKAAPVQSSRDTRRAFVHRSCALTHRSQAMRITVSMEYHNAFAPSRRF